MYLVLASSYVVLHLVCVVQSESKMFNGLEKECSSPTEKLARKESLKVRITSCVCRKGSGVKDAEKLRIQ